MIPRWTRPVLLALVAGSPLPLLAQPVGVDRDMAQEAYVAGDFDAAERILAELLARTPDDPDLLRRSASVDAAQGDLDSAQATIDRAIALAPDDPDIQLARANILFWRGRLEAARAQADAIAVERPDYPGLAALQQSLRRSEDARRLRLRSASVGASVSDARFASGLGQTWYGQRASLSLGWADNAVATLEVDREERRQSDTRVSGRVDLPGGNNRYFVTASATPEADFRERWSIGAGADVAAGRSTALQVDGRFAEYRADDIVVLGAGLRQRLSPNFAVSARTIHLLGGGEDYRFGASLRADYSHPRRPDVFAIISSYPDTEADGTRQLRAAALGTRIAVSQRLTLGVTGEFESREDSYDRLAVALDLRVNFGQP